MRWSDRIGSRLKLRDLHVFLSVANAGTMGRASVELAVSQPVVSKAIADLEHVLGVRLFDRSRRGVDLTAHGRALRDSCLAIFDDVRQGMNQLATLSDPTVGEIRLGTSESVATGFISAAVSKMAIRYPRMTFHVLQSDLNTLRIRELRERNIEFAVGRMLEPINDGEFAVEILFEDPFVVVVGRNSTWARRRHPRLADLVTERWILAPLPGILRVIHRAFEAAGLPQPRADVLTLSILLHNSLLATGKFVTALPRSTFDWGADYLPFKILPIDLPGTSGPVALVTLKGRTLTPPAQTFMACLRELAAIHYKQMRPR